MWTVGFLVIAKQQEQTLAACINSIINEKPDELSIVIHSQSHACRRIIEALNLPYCIDEGKGPSAARNIGLKQLTSDYVIVIDADQVLPKGFLCEVRRVLLHKPDVIFHSERYNDTSAWADALTLEKQAHQCLGEKGIPRIFKRRILEQVGGWDDHLRAYEDEDLWLRIKKSQNLVTIDGNIAICNIDAVTPKKEFSRGKRYSKSLVNFIQKYPNLLSHFFALFPLNFLVSIPFSFALVKFSGLNLTFHLLLLRSARSFGYLTGALLP